MRNEVSRGAKTALVLISVLTAGTIVGATTYAQDIRGTTVTERPRPETDPFGIRVGSFTMNPRLDLRLEYDDNIFATNRNETDDFLFITSPAVNVASDWGRHALNFGASGTITTHFDERDEDTEDASAFVNGRLDFIGDTNVFGGFRFDLRHEDRGSTDDVDGDEPIEFLVYTGRLGVAKRFNRLSLRQTNTLRRFDYKDTLAVDLNNLPIEANSNQDDRDRYVWKHELRVSYNIIPDWDVFIQGAYNRREFDYSRDDFGNKKDSHGFEVEAGAKLDLTGLIFAEFFAGYREQYYDESTFNDFSGYAAGVDLIWNITPLTTIKGGFSRTLEESSLQGASGFFANRARASVDHELLRSLLLNAEVTYTNNDYRGISRDDDIFGVGAGFTYLMNRFVHFSAGYNYLTRESNVGGDDYDRNSFFIQARLQY